MGRRGCPEKNSRCTQPAALGFLLLCPGLLHLHGAGHPQLQGRKEKCSMLPYLLLIWEFLRPGTCTPWSKMFYCMYMTAFSEQTAGSQLGASHTGSDSDLVTPGLQGPPFPPSTSTAEWGSAGNQKALLALNTLH